MGVYALYPQARRFLIVVGAVYGLIILASGAALLHEPWGAWVILLAFYAILSIWGCALTVHFWVMGVPPPEGMEPVERLPEDSSGSDTRVSTGYDRFTLAVIGDDGRPFYAAGPLLFMILVSCCCVPCGSAVVAAFT